MRTRDRSQDEDLVLKAIRDGCYTIKDVSNVTGLGYHVARGVINTHGLLSVMKEDRDRERDKEELKKKEERREERDRERYEEMAAVYSAEDSIARIGYRTGIGYRVVAIRVHIPVHIVQKFMPKLKQDMRDLLERLVIVLQKKFR